MLKVRLLGQLVSHGVGGRLAGGHHRGTMSAAPQALTGQELQYKQA